MPIFQRLQLTIFFHIFVATSTFRSSHQNTLESTDLAPQQRIPESLDCTTEESVLKAVLVKLGLKTQHQPSIAWDGCHVTEIAFRGTDLGLDGSLSSEIGKLQKLKSLVLDGTKVTGELSSLKDATKLQTLVLSGTKVTGELSSLKDATKLQTLLLSGTKVSGELSSLKGATKMKRLSLKVTAVSGDLASLKEATELQTLNLGGTKVSGELSSLKGATKMKSLSLKGTAVGGDLASLKEATKLQTLCLSGTKVTGDLAALKDARKLQELKLSDTKVSGDFSVLLQWPEVEEVDFSGTNIYGILSEDWRGKTKKLLRLRLADAGPQFERVNLVPCAPSVPGGPPCEHICTIHHYTMSEHVCILYHWSHSIDYDYGLITKAAAAAGVVSALAVV